MEFSSFEANLELILIGYRMEDNFDSLIVLRKEYWTVNHRLGSVYPGYLMIQAKEPEFALAKLSEGALAELGTVFAEVEALLTETFEPRRVMFTKLGFSPGYPCHFHALPVHEWVFKEMLDDPKWASEPDGGDVFLYVNRLYCESQEMSKAEKVALDAIARIKSVMKVRS